MGGFWLVSVWIYAYKKLEIWDWERRDLEPAAWKANAGQPERSCWTHGTTAFLERGASVGLTRNMESTRGSRIRRRSPKTRWRRGEGARSAVVGVRSGGGGTTAAWGCEVAGSSPLEPRTPLVPGTPLLGATRGSQIRRRRCPSLAHHHLGASGEGAAAWWQEEAP